MNSWKNFEMTKDRAMRLWQEWKWWVATVLIPFVTWAFLRYDASNLSTRRFERFTDSLQAASAVKDVRDSARQERIGQQLRYLICREDFSRQQCLRPER